MEEKYVKENERVIFTKGIKNRRRKLFNKQNNQRQKENCY